MQTCQALGFVPQEGGDANSCSTYVPSSCRSNISGGILAGTCIGSTPSALATEMAVAAAAAGFAEGLPGTPSRHLSGMPATPSTPGFPSWPVLTPSTLGTLGFSVQNTFIHAAMPPPTPPAGASCRARSLPRNMGATEKGAMIFDEAQAELAAANAAAAVAGAQWPMVPGAPQGPVEQVQLQMGFIGRSSHTPRSRKKGSLLAAAMAEPPYGSDCGANASGSAGVGQRVVRLADLL